MSRPPGSSLIHQDCETALAIGPSKMRQRTCQFFQYHAHGLACNHALNDFVQLGFCSGKGHSALFSSSPKQGTFSCHDHCAAVGFISIWGKTGVRIDVDHHFIFLFLGIANALILGGLQIGLGLSSRFLDCLGATQNAGCHTRHTEHDVGSGSRDDP